jgi:DNA-binding transcriptional regulator PaaX
MERYPLSLIEVISTPSVFRETEDGFRDLPYPNSAIIRDFAEYSGHSYGAVRTALSRARSSAYFEALIDDEGTTRYRLGKMPRSIAVSVNRRMAREEGFAIAVLSFPAGADSKRQAALETLGYYGFARFANNAYIAGKTDIPGLEAELAKLGFERNVFLFECEPSGSKAFSERLTAVFDLESRKKAILEFQKRAAKFLLQKGLGELERGRRGMYTGPISHKVFFTEEPPLPEDWLPKGYPREGAFAEFCGIMKEIASAVRSYYETLCARKGAQR